jgi:hypothetical protein
MINLFKAQNDLNNLISNAQTPEQMDAAKAYLKQLANGANPESPQYVALNFLNQMESAQPPVNAPTGTLKDKLLGMPMPPMQPQGVPMAAAQQPRMQAPQQQPHMANGGVAHLPVPETMYNFKNGGIIGFKTGDTVPDVSAQGLLRQAAQGLQDYQAAQPVDPDVAKAQYIAAHPEMAALARPVAETMSKGIAEQEARDKAEYEKQTGVESQRRKEMALSNALLQAAEQTRGTKGLGSLGPALTGLGGSFNAANAAEMDRLANLAKSKREQDMLTLKYKNEVEAAQRAAADNDFSKHLAYLNAAAQTKSEAAKLGIDVTSKLAGVAGQLEEAKARVAASHVNPYLQLEEAIRLHPEREATLRKVYELTNLGRTGTNMERLQQDYIKEKQEIVKSYRMLQQDPKQKAKMDAELKSLDDQYRAFGLPVVGASGETAAPTSSLLGAPSGQWGTANVKG